MMEMFGYFALIAVGVILGLTGGGGSILAVPILVYLFSLDVILASAYSFFIVGITSIIGVFLKQKDQSIDLKTSLFFGLPSLLTIFLTRKWIVPNIPEIIIESDSLQIAKREFFLSLIGIVIILSGLMLLIKFSKQQLKPVTEKVPFIIISGCIVGVLSGLTGIGGGFLILPALLLLRNISFHGAVGTTLLIVSSNCIIGFIGDALSYQIDWVYLLSITGFAVAGIIIGNMSHKIIPAASLQKIFSWVTLLIGCFILAEEVIQNLP